MTASSVYAAAYLQFGQFAGKPVCGQQIAYEVKENQLTYVEIMANDEFGASYWDSQTQTRQ